MGQVFGKNGVAEPAYDVLYKNNGHFAYEVRKYGQRFAAEAQYNGDDNSPFMILAKYIGVFGTPENEGKEAIAMTAPVVKDSNNVRGGTAIAMTAPVVKSKEAGTGDRDGFKTMDFILPAEYDTYSKIPKPTNPQVTIKEIPPAVGVVHRFNGSMDDKRADEMARQLALQLQQDGLKEMTEEYVLDHYQFWGYNPPFTLPMFRRNEVWVEINEKELDILVNGVTARDAN